jgi:hypothetical protein
LPGFGEAIVFDAYDGGTGELQWLLRGDMDHGAGPVNTGEITFCERNDGSNFEVREWRIRARI